MFRLSIDVSHALHEEVLQGEAGAVSAWVFVPQKPGARAGRVPVIALLNGRTYDKRYSHFSVHGREAEGYSAAKALCDKGYVVVLTDHLGIGESTLLPNQNLVDRRVAAAANHAAITKIDRRLRTVALAPEIAPMESTLLVGGGHSMGGMQIITQQAAHRTFERLIVLGYTALGVHLTIGYALVSADPGPLDLSSPQYVLAQRGMLRSTFHWEDVPDDVVAVDDSLLVEVPYVLSAQSLTTGIIADDAGAIDVPVLMSLGQRDVSPSPHDEPACYRSSPDVTLHILPRSAHCQSFATTRHELYARIDGWLRSIEA